MPLTNGRRAAAGLALLLATGAPGPASALDRDDTMAAWQQAEAGERSRLLDRLQAENPKLRRADRGKLMECLDGAAAFPQHGDFRIGDLADACADPDAPTGDAI